MFHCDHINLFYAAFKKQNQVLSFFPLSFNLKKYNDYIQTLICISADVLSEEAILKWYKEAHVAKGKSVFLDQMKKFVEWLQNAEEGMDSFKAMCQSLCESKCVSSQILVAREVYRLGIKDSGFDCSRLFTVMLKLNSTCCFLIEGVLINSLSHQVPLVSR